MANEQLLLYIKQRQSRGASAADIKNALISRGWKESMVQEALDSLTAPPAPGTPIMNTSTKKYIYWLGGIFLLICLILFTVPIVLGVFSKDDPPGDDQDLFIDTTPISQDQNAYDDVQKIPDNLVYNSDEIYRLFSAKTTEWNGNQVTDLMLKNFKLFLLVDTILKKPKYQNPGYDKPANTAPYNIVALEASFVPRTSAEKAALIMQVKAEQLQVKQLMKEANALTAQIISFGQLLTAYQPTLADYIAGLAVKQTGLEEMQFWLGSYKKEEDLRQQISNMDAYKNNTDGLIFAVKKEYALEKKLISDASKENFSDVAAQLGFPMDPLTKLYRQNNFLFQPVKTTNISMQFFRQAVNDVQLSCSMVRQLRSAQLAKPHVAPIMAFTQNSVGSAMTDKMTGDIDVSQLLKYRCDDLLLVNATQLMLGIRLYYLLNTKYPAHLADLVPKYLHEVPQDPYDETPLKYSADKKIIYSVGVGGTDQGGSEGDDWTMMENPRFKIQGFKSR